MRAPLQLRSPPLLIMITISAPLWCAVHGTECGHVPVLHHDHIDYLVDAHLHHPHGDHCDDHGSVRLATDDLFVFLQGLEHIPLSL